METHALHFVAHNHIVQLEPTMMRIVAWSAAVFALIHNLYVTATRVYWGNPSTLLPRLQPSNDPPRAVFNRVMNPNAFLRLVEGLQIVIDDGVSSSAVLRRKTSV